MEHAPKKPEHRWPAGVPDVVWAPMAAGALMLLVGGIGLAFRQPLLFPSLGSTAFLQTESPQLPGARFYNTVVGHGVGLAAGFLAMLVLGAQQAPSVLATQQFNPAPAIGVLSIVLTLLVGYLLRASHPPAAATTLLVALGGFSPTITAIRTVVIGVLIIAIAGEALRRLRLGQG